MQVSTLTFFKTSYTYNSQGRRKFAYVCHKERERERERVTLIQESTDTLKFRDFKI